MRIVGSLLRSISEQNARTSGGRAHNQGDSCALLQALGEKRHGDGADEAVEVLHEEAGP